MCTFGFHTPMHTHSKDVSFKEKKSLINNKTKPFKILTEKICILSALLNIIILNTVFFNFKDNAVKGHQDV